MALTGNLITDKKLVRAKRMYQHAVLLATGQPDEMTRIRAVLEFDWVIELTLKTLLAHHNQTKARSESLNELLQAFDTLLQTLNKPPLSERGHISHIRAVRNAAQHEARDPTDTELTECHIYTRDFLVAVLRDLWGLTLDQVSLAGLIQTPLLAELLQEADAALDAQDWLLATELAMLALEIATNASKNQLIFDHWDRAFGAPTRFPAENVEREVRETLESIQRVLHLLALGIDYPAHRAFLKATGHIILYLGGNYVYQPPPAGINETTARAAISYIIDTILQIEQRLGSLKATSRPQRPPRQIAQPSDPPSRSE